MPSRRVKPPAKIERKLLSRTETAAMLGGIHDRTVDAMVKRGQLKAVRLGRRNMITAESIGELIAAK
jgi:excisionase family DNA binding protein